MGLKDLAPGDLLYKILNPRANEVRLDRNEKDIAKLRKYAPRHTPGGGGDSESGQSGDDGGGGVVGRRVPPPNIDTFIFTPSDAFTNDGVYQPQLTIVETSEFHTTIRGFKKYQVRVTYPDGRTQDMEGTAYTDGNPTTMGLSLTPAVDGSYVTIKARAVSELYGAGPWSEPRTVLMDVKANSVATPPAPTITGKMGAIVVNFTVPDIADFPDYSHTEIWKGVGSGFTTGVLITADKSGACEVTWDNKADVIAAYDYVKVVDVDNSGNRSSLSPGAAIDSTVTDSTLIETEHIDDDAITTGNIAPGAVTDTEIATDAVTTIKIQALAVTGPKVAALAIGTGHLDALAVTSAKIAAGAVIAGKIAAGGVSASNQFGLGVVDSNALGNLSVVAGKLAAGSISSTTLFGAGVVDNAAIASGVDAGKLTTGTLPIARIATGAIDGTKLNTALSYGGTITLTSGAKIQAAGANIELGDNGLIMKSVNSAGGTLIDFYDDLGDRIATIEGVGRDSTGSGGLKIDTVLGSGLQIVPGVSMDRQLVVGSNGLSPNGVPRLKVMSEGSASDDILQLTDESSVSYLTMDGHGKLMVGAKSYFGSASTAPAAQIHIAGGSSSANTAPIKLTSGTVMSTAEPGAVEYDGQTFFVTPKVDRRGLSTSEGVIKVDASVSNTLTEGTIYTKTFPANELTSGRVIRMHLRGYYTTANALAVGTFRFKFAGSTISTVTNTGATVTGAPFYFDVDLTVRGTAPFTSVAWYNRASINNVSKDAAGTSTVNFTSTSSNVFEATAQWGALSNTITLTEAWFEYVN